MTRDLQRVTYVDDDPDVRAITTIALETIGGLVVDAYSSGPEALDKIGHFLPDLILLDVMMPGMTGPETFDRLKRLPDLTGVPVLFMTAKAQAHEIAGYRAQGAADVIVKPFDPMTLAEEIRGVWDRMQPRAPS